MKINRKFLPIKAHYFLFLGCVSPILPFMIVVARQLGIPVIVQGTVGSVILIVTVLVKPFVAAATDAFPKARKGIFLLILSMMVCSYFAINFLPPMHLVEKNDIQGNIYSPKGENWFETELFNGSNIDNGVESSLFLTTDKGDSCYPQELWDCVSECNASDTFSAHHILLEEKNEKMKYLFNVSEDYRIYTVKNPKVGSTVCGYEQRLVCEGALYTGDGCRSLWANPLFYLYLTLLTVGFVTFAIGNSVTDAICMDLIGAEGDYGNERAWGTVGWGLMGPVSGLFIDWYSGDKFGKNYLPAFLILFFLGSCDILLSAAKLQVPQMEKNDDLWRSVGRLMKQPQFFTFLLFVVVAGSFDGVIVSYIFVLQEEMAKNTEYMRYIKFIQGLTLGVQCSLEAPFMWVCGWFIKKMGSSAVMCLVFFLYIIRLFALALAGSYGPVWMTLVTEILNGPTYGLGYTAIVIQAGQVTPPGTSATVQSITNICYESLGYALASLLGGILITVLGGPGLYYTFGCVSVVTFILHCIFLKWENKNINIEKPQGEDSLLRDKAVLTPDSVKENEEVFQANTTSLSEVKTNVDEEIRKSLQKVEDEEREPLRKEEDEKSVSI